MRDEHVDEIANAIIEQAVTDWRRLCKRTKNGKPLSTRYTGFTTFEKLRAFFKSDWCAMLCRSVNPSVILEKLEQERLEALEIGGYL